MMKRIILFSAIIFIICASSAAFGYHYALSSIRYGSNFDDGFYPRYHDMLDEPKKPLFESDYEREKYLAEAKQYLEDLNTYIENAHHDIESINQEKVRAKSEILVFSDRLKRYLTLGI